MPVRPASFSISEGVKRALKHYEGRLRLQNGSLYRASSKQHKCKHDHKSELCGNTGEAHEFKLGDMLEAIKFINEGFVVLD